MSGTIRLIYSDVVDGRRLEIATELTREEFAADYDGGRTLNLRAKALLRAADEAVAMQQEAVAMQQEAAQ